MKKLMVVLVMVMFSFSLAMAADQKEAVVKELLPDSDLKAQTFNVTEAIVAKVQAGLANKMPVRPVYEIYVSKTGVVVIEEQMGKWGVIKMGIAIDPKTKKVANIGFISMSEKRGAGIKQQNFIKQFVGKDAEGIELGKTINGVSGATVSSKAVVIAAKRALIIYEAFTAKK